MEWNFGTGGIKTSTTQMALGLVISANHYQYILLPNSSTCRFQGLVALLMRYVKLVIPKACAQPITSIHLTKDLEGTEHVDDNNMGRSIGVSFGPFRGGRHGSRPTTGQCLVLYRTMYSAMAMCSTTRARYYRAGRMIRSAHQFSLMEM